MQYTKNLPYSCGQPKSASWVSDFFGKNLTPDLKPDRRDFRIISTTFCAKIFWENILLLYGRVTGPKLCNQQSRNGPSGSSKVWEIYGSLCAKLEEVACETCVRLWHSWEASSRFGLVLGGIFLWRRRIIWKSFFDLFVEYSIRKWLFRDF